MCEIWMETRDHAESQNRLLQLGVLETESETGLKVQDFYHGVEINTCGRERTEAASGRERKLPECCLDKGLSSSHGELRSWDGPSEMPRDQTQGLDL